MRALAELIMRGRVHASVAVLLGTLVPFVTPAVVALVTLRKGAVEGTLILFIGLLPTLVTFGTNEAQPLVFMFTVLGLVAVYASALVLKQTESLSLALMTLLASSVVALLLIKQLVPGSLHYLIDSLSKAVTERAVAAGIDNLSVGINEVSLTGLLAVIIMLNGVCSLFLGRWWQALLYNPGGFGADFRQLRLGFTTAIICLMVSVYFLVQEGTYFTWSFIFALPLMLVTIAIVHGVAKSSKNAKQWLVIFYIAIIVLGFLQLINYVQIVLMGVGFLDNWLNFRSRKSQLT